MDIMRRWAAGISVSAALALVAVTPAWAATLRYAGGDYVGKVSQMIPQRFTGSIGFSIRRGVLTALRFKVKMVCGRLLLAQVASPPTALRVRVRRDGTFSYAGTIGGARLRIHGSVRGRRATGVFFESFHTTARYACTMYAPASFRARRGST